MITNFEEFTTELSKEEMEILPLVINGFKNYNKENPIKADMIVFRMNNFLSQNGYKMKLTQPRLRKFVNYIRTNGVLPLIATSHGYYVSSCSKTILSQIKSLQERANSIERCAQGLKKFL
jgi:hypothetical protein